MAGFCSAHPRTSSSRWSAGPSCRHRSKDDRWCFLQVSLGPFRDWRQSKSSRHWRKILSLDWHPKSQSFSFRPLGNGNGNEMRLRIRIRSVDRILILPRQKTISMKKLETSFLASRISRSEFGKTFRTVSCTLSKYIIMFLLFLRFRGGLIFNFNNFVFKSIFDFWLKIFCPIGFLRVWKLAKICTK